MLGLPRCTPSLPPWACRQDPTLTQHALPYAAQLHVGCVEGLGRAPVQGLLLPVDHDGAALLQDPLGGPFHHHEEALVV